MGGRKSSLSEEEVGNDQCSTPVWLCLRCHTRGDFVCTLHREQSQTHLCHWVLEKLLWKKVCGRN